MVEHVYEKVLGTNSEAVGAAPPPPPPPSSAGGGAEAEERPEGSSSLAEDRVELLCNDQVRLDGQGDSVIPSGCNNGLRIIYSWARDLLLLFFVGCFCRSFEVK